MQSNLSSKRAAFIYCAHEQAAQIVSSYLRNLAYYRFTCERRSGGGCVHGRVAGRTGRVR